MFAPSPKRVELASSIASSSEPHRHDRRDRSERLLAQQRGLGRRAGHHRRRHEPALRVARVVAAEHDLRARADRRLELALDLRALRLGDHRPHVGVVGERVADAQRARVLDERGQEVVVDRVVDVEALRGRAHLSGVQVRRPRAAARGDLDLRRHVGADDERVLATELEVDARDAVDAGVRDPLAGLDRAGERDAVHARVLDDPRADVAAARHDVDRAGGERLEAVGERERRQRRQLRRLAHARVAGRERRGELPGQQQQRVVPRHDAGDDAHRLLDHERELGGLDRRDHAAGEVAAHLGVVVERRRRPADLVGVLDARLAALARHDLGQLVGLRADARGDLVEHLAALERRDRRPHPRRLARRRDRRVDLLVGGQRDGREHLGARGVLDVEPLAVALDELAADQQLHFRSHGITVLRNMLFAGAEVSGSRCEFTFEASTSRTRFVGTRDDATSRRAPRSTRPRVRSVWIA